MDIFHEKPTFFEEHFRQSGMSCDPVANSQIQSDANEEASRSSKKYRMFCDIIKTLLTIICYVKLKARQAQVSNSHLPPSSKSLEENGE